MSTENKKVAENPAVQAKRSFGISQQPDSFKNKDGVTIELRPVAAYAIQEAVSKIKKPHVPLVPHPNDPNDITKFIENPMDETYRQEVEEYEREVEKASLDAMVMFGIDIDKLPENDKWLKKLIHSDYISADENLDEFSMEFLYKKYYVAIGGVIGKISSMSGIVQEDIDLATDSFRG